MDLVDIADKYSAKQFGNKMTAIINHGIYWKEDLLSVELRVISGGNVNSFQSDTHNG